MRERLEEIEVRCEVYAAYLERQMRVLPSMPERWLDTGEEVRLLLEERGLLFSEIERLSGEVRRLEGESERAKATIGKCVVPLEVIHAHEQGRNHFCPEVKQDIQEAVMALRAYALTLARAAGE